MIKKITQLIIPNLPLKLLSGICGFLVWSVISQSHVVTITRQVPVCVYNTEQTDQISVPEMVQVTLQAPRNRLYTVDTHELAIHIDAARLQPGDNPLRVDRSSLFLPDGINVVHYTPSNTKIEITRI